MKRTLISIIFISISFIVYGQVHPDLGLHGQITWLSDTKIRVEYDWSSDSQLLDWRPTNGSTLVRGNGNLTVKGGSASVKSIVWKQLMKCTRINAQNAKAINSQYAHLNFITNVLGWTGYNFNPPEMIGLLYISYGNLWLENGTNTTMPGPAIVLGKMYNIDINISNSAITSKSSSDNILYSYNLTSPPDKDREVGVGVWGVDTEWGKLIIEGEITVLTTPWQPPSDMINIQSSGALFTPVIEVSGNPVIEWVFDDGTTSSSATPTKDYGSLGSRHNLLKVTPWSSLIGINLGYDAVDGGYGGFAIVDNQKVLGIQNLTLAKNSLQYFCASYSPLTEMDMRELTALKFVELLYCPNLITLKLGSHPVLERLCVEDCNLASLDLSGCPALKDLRGASNNFTSINWGSIGSQLLHMCVRTNSFNVNLPDMTQFPILRELLTWDDNQTGAFVCHSSVIQRIDTYDNHYTSADVSGCTSLALFSLSGSKLSSLQLGTANNLTDVRLNYCGLTESQMDYVLRALDEAGRSDGHLELSGNEAPSGDGLIHNDNLKGKGWIIIITNSIRIVPVTSIIISGNDGLPDIVANYESFQLMADVFPSDATDKTVTWSIVNGTGQASITPSGLFTALTEGTVTIIASAADGSGITGTKVITISRRTEPVVIVIDEGQIKVTLDESYSSCRLSLYNLQGHLIISKFADGNQCSFDIDSLRPGIYLIVLSQDLIQRVGKVIVPG